MSQSCTATLSCTRTLTQSARAEDDLRLAAWVSSTFALLFPRCSGSSTARPQYTGLQYDTMAQAPWNGEPAIVLHFEAFTLTAQAGFPSRRLGDGHARDGPGLSRRTAAAAAQSAKRKARRDQRRRRTRRLTSMTIFGTRQPVLAPS